MAILVASPPCAAAITNVQVTGVTNTQAILSYTAPDANACTVEVSESAAYSPLVYDVDASLFPGANLDSREGSITVGRSRTFVAGARLAATAADGSGPYSRALQTATRHYFRISCGADRATGTFTTATIPLGRTYSDPLQAGAGGNLVFATTKTPKTIDPRTGVALYNVDMSNWANDASSVASPTAFTVREAGANWTNPDNILGNTGAATTNTQNPIWIRQPTLPSGNRSSFSKWFISFSNILLDGSCSGPTCASDGIQVCYVYHAPDPATGTPACDGPWITAALPSSKATVTVKTAASDNTPGDNGLYTNPFAWRGGLSSGGVYTVGGASSSVTFTDMNDCRRLRAGSKITTYLGGQQTVTSLNCASSPATATLASSANLSTNGTTGYPFSYDIDFTSPFYGVVIRKLSSDPANTISLQNAKWRGGIAIGFSLQWSSAGYSRMCSRNPDPATGFFLCATDSTSTGIYAYREVNGVPEHRYLGMAFWTSPKSGFSGMTTGLAEWTFDDNNPRVWYFTGLDANSKLTVYKATYNGDYSANTPNWNNNGELKTVPVTLVALNPCLGSCATETDDQSIPAQMKRFTSGYYDNAKFPNCGISASMGRTLSIGCSNGPQNSLGWLGAFDLGNGLPLGAGYVGTYGNTQQVFAAYLAPATKGSRWCGGHATQTLRWDEAYTSEWHNMVDSNGATNMFQATLTNNLANCSKSGNGTCEACPSISVDGRDYTGKNWCGRITTTSAWNGSWGAQPGSFNAGDPVNTGGNLHWLADPAGNGGLHVSDLVQANWYYGEIMKVIQVNGPGDYYVERGYGVDQSLYHPNANSSGTVLSAICSNDIDGLTDQTPSQGTMWFYKLDPTGADYSKHPKTSYINHALARPNVRMTANRQLSFAPFVADPAAMADNVLTASMGYPSTFAAASFSVDGDSVEKHPSYNQEAAPASEQNWILDAHPQQFTGNAGSGAYLSTNVSGDLWKVVLKNRNWINPRILPLMGFSTNLVGLTDVSGPSSTLTGAASDNGKLCVALNANECVAGSAAGDIYANVPSLDGTQAYCREGTTSAAHQLCVANFNTWGASFTQEFFPPPGVATRNMSTGRVLAYWQGYTGASTANIKPTPDGKYFNVPAAYFTNYAGKMPPAPAPDSINRGAYVPIPVRLPGGGRFNNAIVEFGYDPNFYCMPRREACVAVDARGFREGSLTANGTALAGSNFDTATWKSGSKINIQGTAWTLAGVPTSSTATINSYVGLGTVTTSNPGHPTISFSNPADCRQLPPGARITVGGTSVTLTTDESGICTTTTTTATAQINANPGWTNQSFTANLGTATYSWDTEFSWASETYAGQPCSSGCTITIPAISGKVLYYRWKYRDASNNVLETSGVHVTAVP